MANKKCKCHRKKKHIPYGSCKEQEWCPHCDGNLVVVVDKGAARKKAKRLIKKEIEEINENT